MPQAPSTTVANMQSTGAETLPSSAPRVGVFADEGTYVCGGSRILADKKFSVFCSISETMGIDWLGYIMRDDDSWSNTKVDLTAVTTDNQIKQDLQCNLWT